VLPVPAAPAARPFAPPLIAVCAAALLLLAAGCRGGAPDGFVLRPLVEARGYGVGQGEPRDGKDGLRFSSAPVLADVEVDHERRPVVLTTGAPWSWTGRVPAHGELHAGVQLVPAAWRRVRRMQAQVVVREGRHREVLQVARWAGGADAAVWLDLSAGLERYAGRRVTLVLSATLGGLPGWMRGANLVAWGPVALTGPGGSRREPAASPASPGPAGGAADTGAAGTGAAGTGAPGTVPPGGRPNIILILVDTLRRDRLTAYGYRRETSPEIGRRLAAAGTVMEDAYSQAPWTLPSVVSLMTGRYPGEVLGGDLSTYGIPAAVQPLAERLRRAGFETAGFIGNPTMHVGAGFERGFHTLYAPPADIDWLNRHADDINRHALPWVLAQQDQARPFFLYLHYIDPHDPYANPETAGNRSQFEGEYHGKVAGDWVHGFYTGNLKLEDPVRDVAHLSALYDSEVHYVDGRIGEVLAALRPEVLAHTVVALVADHGEELFDHGGWKHGQSLYEEQIHVPMIWRWDGRIAAGRRLAGTVRLLDVAPTLAAAAGVPPDPEWEGASLLPALTGAAPLGERPAFAEAMSGGPLLAAAVAGREKLIVYNREEVFAPTDALQSYVWRHNLERLAAVEVYDLARDPGERRNLAPGSPPDRLPLLAEVVERHLDRSLPGLRLTAAGIPAGSRLRLELTLGSPARRWVPYLLGAADRVSQDGARLTVELAGASPVARGVRIEGDFLPAAGQPGEPGGAAGARAASGGAEGPSVAAGGGAGRQGGAAAGGAAVVALTAALDGRPLPAARVRIGAGVPYAGGPLELAALRTASFPAGPPGESSAAGAPAAAGAGSQGAAGLGAAGGGGARGAAGPGASASGEARGAEGEVPWVALWLHSGTGGVAPRGHDAEMERRLRALGYIE
jgi:arylsulfatase A-like enzyme